jgi:hypothetical protein
LAGTTRMVALVAAALLALGATSCGGDDGGDEGGGDSVAVTLQEFAIGATPSSIGAGEVTFEAENVGPEDEHELVVLRTDLAPDALPTNEDGSVDEEGEGVELIGEIEEFPVGETQSASFDLEAGSYVLICNIYDAQEQEAHYQEGMRLGFTVE